MPSILFTTKPELSALADTVIYDSVDIGSEINLSDASYEYWHTSGWIAGLDGKIHTFSFDHNILREANYEEVLEGPRLSIGNEEVSLDELDQVDSFLESVTKLLKIKNVELDDLWSFLGSYLVPMNDKNSVSEMMENRKKKREEDEEKPKKKKEKLKKEKDKAKVKKR